MLETYKKYPILYFVSIPLIIIGLVFFIMALIAGPTSMTADGQTQLRTLYLILGLCFFGATIVLIISILVITLLNQKKIERLAKMGTPGTAKIMKISDTGVVVNEQPQMKLIMEINLDGYEKYAIEKKMVVPQSKLDQVSVDSEVKIVVDTKDHKNPENVGLILKD